MDDPTIVLITGANRGIGKGLLAKYLAKPNHVVIAGNRSPEDETSKSLASLPTADGTKLIVVKIDATVADDPAKAVQELKESHGIEHLGIVIANAGIALSWPKVSEAKVEDMRTHNEPNVFGFVLLFQATLPLLKKSTKGPKLVSMGSSAAFLTNMLEMPNAVYAQTKVVVHWLTKRIHIEEPWLTAFPIDPGWVQTGIGNRGAEWFGYKEAAITVETSTAGLIKVIDAATRESHSGRLWVYDGREEPW